MLWHTVSVKARLLSFLRLSSLQWGGRDSVQSLSRVQLFVTPWTAAYQPSLSITNSRSLLKLMSIESVMPPNHLLLCCPLLLLPLIFPRIRVFSNELVLHIRWPKYWSLSFSISPSNEYSGLISFRIDWLDLLAVQGNCTPWYFLAKTEKLYPYKNLHMHAYSSFVHDCQNVEVTKISFRKMMNK